MPKISTLTVLELQSAISKKNVVNSVTMDYLLSNTLLTVVKPFPPKFSSKPPNVDHNITSFFTCLSITI